MPQSIKDLYNQVEQIKGKKLFYLLLTIFAVFLLIGLSIGYVTTKVLTKNEIDEMSKETEIIQKNEFSGRVQYTDPHFYPNDKISYVLVDSDGKDIILLSAKDSKLEIVEGLYVKVMGRVGKLSDGKTEYLNVSEVVVNQ